MLWRQRFSISDVKAEAKAAVKAEVGSGSAGSANFFIESEADAVEMKCMEGKVMKKYKKRKR